MGSARSTALTSIAVLFVAGGPVRDTTPRRLSHVLVLSLCCALVLGAVPADASPASINAARKEVAAARTKMDQLSTQLELRTEEYLAAKEALAKTRKQL